MSSERTAGKKKSTSATKKKTVTAKKAVKKKAVKKKTTTKKKSTVKRKTSTASSSGAAKRLRIRQVRSGVGYAQSFRRTLTALGLKHHQDEVVVPDNPSVRGMINKVHHLVSVTSEES
jgi:large subunit ribosomal protein L30